jgi:hypothetical protein
VGWLRNPGSEIAFLPETELRSFGEAVLRVGEEAKVLGYATVRPQYMEDFGRLV